MDLIDFYDSQTKESFSNRLNLRKTIDSFLLRNDLNGLTTHWLDNKLELTVAIKKSATVEFSGSVALDLSDLKLSIRVSTVQCNKPEGLYIISLLRSILEINANTSSFILKINPQTGELSIHSIFVLDQVQLIALNSNYFFDTIFSQIDKARSQLLRTVILVQALRTTQYSSAQSKNDMLHRNLSLCKRYITASTVYAWQIFDPKHTFLPSDYTQLKRTYRKIRSPEYRDSKLKFRRLFNSLTVQPAFIDKFFQLSKPDDEEIQKEYLSVKANVRRSEGMVEGVEGSEREVEEVMQTGNQGIVEIGNKKFRVRVTDYERVARELYVVNCLPNQRHQSLPKYAILQSTKQNQKKFILNQEVEGITYCRYLKLNCKVMSLNTKLHMLSDIARTLLYLKNNQVVYNNLTPNNLKVKKNLQIVFQDLSNAYHTSMSNKLSKQPKKDCFTEPKNKLPYVSHQHLTQQNSFKSQSSDVFSFGTLLFSTLFNKNLFSSGRHSPNFRRMLQKPVLSPQFFSRYHLDHLKLLAHFALKAATHSVENAEELLKAAKEEETQVDPKGLKGRLTERRPYMDWLYVVVEYVRRYLDRRMPDRSVWEQGIEKFYEETDKRFELEMKQQF